jgi:hypothetical protein
MFGLKERLSHTHTPGILALFRALSVQNKHSLYFIQSLPPNPTVNAIPNGLGSLLPGLFQLAVVAAFVFCSSM